MNTYFSTVPVEVARQKQIGKDAEGLPCLVLVVNEEPLIAETLAAILSGRGLAAMVASTVDMALDTVELTPPEMLIADAAMADMSGFDLAIEVTRRVPDCDVILFSGPNPADQVNQCPGLEGRTFSTLRKPVHPTDLLNKVFERIEQKKQSAQPEARKLMLDLGTPASGQFAKTAR